MKMNWSKKKKPSHSIWATNAMIFATLLTPLSAMAQGIPSSGVPVNLSQTNSTSTSSHSSTLSSGLTSATGKNLDFSATAATVAASRAGTVTIGGSLAGNGQIVGGTAMSVLQGMLVTPAMNAALWQSISSGSQHLLLNTAGAAIGGSAKINSSWASNISSLVVPAGVSLAAAGFNSNTPLNVSGSSNILGSVFTLQNTPNTTALLNFNNNIHVGAGALLTGSLPQVAGLNVSNLYASQNMTLNVMGNLTNNGTISVPGNLNVNVGGTLTNAGLPGSSAGGASMLAQNINIMSGFANSSPLSSSIVNSGLIQAVESLNLINGTNSAFNIVNSGTLKSVTGSINIASPAPVDVLFNNTGGTINAEKGSLNVRDNTFAGNANFDLSGGDLHLNSANIYSGDGVVNVNVGDLTGPINVNAGEAHIAAATQNLYLGQMNLSGDPTYYNTAGNVVIQTPLTFPGAALAIVASGDITTDVGAGAIDTSNPSGSGGQLNIIAGANFTSTGPASGSNDTTSTLSITGASTTGGKIDLVTGTPITSLTTQGSVGAGGAINLIAFAGSAAGSGTIATPSAVSINTNGSTNGGAVNVIAGANSGTSISVGSINTVSANGATGAVGLNAATPTLGTVTILNGAITAGAFAVGPQRPASISAGSISTNGAAIILNSGASAFSGSLNSSRTTGSGSGGAITISTNSALPFLIDAAASVNGIAGTVTAQSLTATGGNVNIKNSGSGGISLTNPSSISVSTNNGAGGTIVLNANAGGGAASGALSIGAGTLSTDAAGTGAAGNITLSGLTLSVPGASPLLLSANGSTNGAGGTISVTATGLSGDLSIGSGAGQVQISASGAAGGGNGGSISFNAAHNLTVDPTAIAAAPQFNSKGTNYTLTAGNNLFVSSSLNANGAGTGQGGTVSLTTTNAIPFNISAGATTNGLNGIVSANGGGSGVGGSITVTNNGNGGISLGSAANVTVTAGSGNGGTISLNAAPGGNGGILTIAGGGTLSTAANGAGNAGNLTLRALQLNITGGSPLTLNANGGATSGNGATISVTTTGTLGDISVGASGQLLLSAAATSGSAGSFTLSAGRSLTVDPAGITSTTSTNGATFTFSSANAANGNLFVNGSLNANALPGGNGGTFP